MEEGRERGGGGVAVPVCDESLRQVTPLTLGPLAWADADFCAIILFVFPLTSLSCACSSEFTSAEGRVAAEGRACIGSTFSMVHLQNRSQMLP